MMVQMLEIPFKQWLTSHRYHPNKIRKREGRTGDHWRLLRLDLLQSASNMPTTLGIEGQAKELEMTKRK